MTDIDDREETATAELVPRPAGTEIDLGEARPTREPIAIDYTRTDGKRRPIIADHWRGWHNIRSTISHHAEYKFYQGRFHGARLHLYVPQTAFWAAVGVFRLVIWQIEWWWFLEQHHLRSLAVAQGDAKQHMRLHAECKRTRKVRGIVLLAELVFLVIAGLSMVAFAPWWGWAALGAVAVPVLARLGHPDDKPIVRKAEVPSQVQKPTPEIITAALGALGIALINQAIRDGQGIHFVTDVHRDGEGWRADIDLPHGVTVHMILQKRSELASALRRPLSAVWPEAVPAEHEARMILWIGYHDISKVKPKPWPLLKTGTANLFEPIPFGTDPRGRPIQVSMFEVNHLIGSAPGQGKTTILRELGCAAALDPDADLWVHEHSGKGDLESLAKVSHRYVSGIDDESIAYAAKSLHLLRGELERRSDQFKKLPREARPHGKLTRELAAERRLKLRLLVAIFDEVHNLFGHPKYGDQAKQDAMDVARLGRAYGIIIILATQRPDKDSLPTTLRSVMTSRFCLKVMDQDTNDMILGTGAYKLGYNAMLFRTGTDAGLGWMRGETEGQIVRTYWLDLLDTEKVIGRARAARERAGTLSGYALGDTEGTGRLDVRADVLACFAGEPGLWWQQLAERLASRFPDRWADVTAEAVSAECRARGVPSVDVKIDRRSLKGCRRADLERAPGQ